MQIFNNIFFWENHLFALRRRRDANPTRKETGEKGPSEASPGRHHTSAFRPGSSRGALRALKILFTTKVVWL